MYSRLLEKCYKHNFTYIVPYLGLRKKVASVSVISQCSSHICSSILCSFKAKNDSHFHFFSVFQPKHIFQPLLLSNPHQTCKPLQQDLETVAFTSSRTKAIAKFTTTPNRGFLARIKLPNHTLFQGRAADRDCRDLFCWWGHWCRCWSQAGGVEVFAATELDQAVAVACFVHEYGKFSMHEKPLWMCSNWQCFEGRGSISWSFPTHFLPGAQGWVCSWLSWCDRPWL